jgi:hypothetical protein
MSKDAMHASIPKLTEETLVVASSDQVSADLGGDAAILQLGNGIYYGLDPVGARVWALVQEPRRVGDVKQTLLREYDVDAKECERDLFELLEKLLDAGLLTVRPAETRADNPPFGR